MRKVNWTAVLVASVVHFLLGAVWFTVLKEPWFAALGTTQEQMMAKAGPGPIFYPYIVAFLCNVVIARVLAQVIVATSAAPNMFHGIRVAFYAWGGFVATTFLTEYVFEMRGWTGWAIVTGYPLLGMIIMGAILGAWQKKDAAPQSSAASA